MLQTFFPYGFTFIFLLIIGSRALEMTYQNWIIELDKPVSSRVNDVKCYSALQYPEGNFLVIFTLSSRRLGFPLVCIKEAHFFLVCRVEYSPIAPAPAVL